uniref:Metallophosphoesterase n=1 Tax=uncultured Candidatus Melainabacteria bacterium TaxID=2682970 RepID=A0A650EJU4_9BACT|nr:metallophosphoesterase [uncultured Candidatus Melainabacteria bacterium]
MKNKILIIFILLFIIIWSIFIEPNLLSVKTYKVFDNQLSGIKIVLVGDFHIKQNQTKQLKQVVSLINKQNADVVLSIGDFVNGHNKKMTLPIENIAAELKYINKPFYTVLGNHDWWFDGEKITKELTNNKIKVLENNNSKINIKNKIIYLAGVTDPVTQKPDVFSALDNTQTPTILLTHSPDIFPIIPNNVNLTLAGHTHGGQVRLPIIGSIITPSEYGNKYSYGYINENNKKMIITKGLGTSILPIRFNCLPEVVVIEFISE